MITGALRFVMIGQSVSIVIMDFHIKRPGAFGNGLTNTAHAKDAEALAT